MKFFSKAGARTLRILSYYCIAAFGMGAVPAQALSIAGTWTGELVLGSETIPLVLHLTGEEGAWEATLDSPRQGAFGLKALSVTRAGNRLQIRFAAPEASFEGSLSKDGSSLSGTWSQGGAALPLRFAREAGAARGGVLGARPQTPRPPYPYRSEEVAFDSSGGRAHLAGTLTLPEGNGPHPAILLISGSGLQDRDQHVFGHRPFLVWADYLSRRGFAVLRFDDRQIGGSTGDAANATTADFVEDAQGGVRFLRSRAEIDPTRVGLMGHSEGAIVGAIVASRDPATAFLVMLAGVGERGDDLLVGQMRELERLAGMPPETVERSTAILRHLHSAVMAVPLDQPAEAALQAAWCAILEEDGQPACTPMPEWALTLRLPWMRWFLRYDPSSTLAKVSCPVLAVTGSNDLQTPARTNLDGIRRGLRNGVPATILRMDGLNHLLQHSSTGDPAEYPRIEETIAPEVLQTVHQWLASQVGQREPATGK